MTEHSRKLLSWLLNEDFFHSPPYLQALVGWGPRLECKVQCGLGMRLISYSRRERKSAVERMVEVRVWDTKACLSM